MSQMCPHCVPSPVHKPVDNLWTEFQVWRPHCCGCSSFVPESLALELVRQQRLYDAPFEIS